MGVVQRNEIFLHNKNKKIESARAEQINKEVEGCTFEPKLFIYKPPRSNSANKFYMIQDNSTQMSKKSFASEKGGNQESYSTIYEKRQSLRSKSVEQN